MQEMKECKQKTSAISVIAVCIVTVTPYKGLL